MKTVTYYDKGDRVIVQFGRGKGTREMIIVGRWAPGEGHGYAAKLPGQANHECIDVSARRILPST